MTDTPISNASTRQGKARAAADTARTMAGKSKDGVKKAAKAGLDKTAKGLDRAQRTVTQSDAFEAFNAAMAEMTMVVSVQHARISDLERRLAALESQVGTHDDGRDE